ncbi:MAG: cytochrome c3 family protein [bacterium]|nr:cytochrome c3 family protein [bacterium]
MRFVLLIMLCCASSIFAQLSPGDLSQFHAKLEGLNNCTQCHEEGDEVTAAKCLKCHSAIGQRIDADRGFHASAEVKAQRCAKCHGEHFGREFELVYWKDGKEKLDHSRTGWPLAGAHAKQQCAACHGKLDAFGSSAAFDSTTNRQRTYLGLSRDCASCHADEHGEQLANDCATCHTEESWTPAAKFVHDKSAYPLTGKHASVECVKCHRSELAPFTSTTGQLVDKLRPTERTLYKPLDFSSCKSCHKDVHEGKFGPNCSACHTTESLAVAQMAKDFDHTKTDFPLTGKHTAVQCAKCHTSGRMTEPVAHAKCSDCHKDQHRGQFAARADAGACESCHTVESFIPARYGMTEHGQSKFPLSGSHLAVPCIACHAPKLKDARGEYAQFTFADQSCKGCHADVHRGQLDKYMQQGSCEFCHNVESWHKVAFDHKTTGFPLVGKHDQTECMSCHVRENLGAEGAPLRMAPLARECELCHKDPHRGQFVTDTAAEVKIRCSRCHTPDAWKQLLFDHSRDARWALDGAHQKVACNSCHKPQTDADGQFVTYRPLAFACSDCHGGTAPSKP